MPIEPTEAAAHDHGERGARARRSRVILGGTACPITCSRTCAWTRGSLTPLPPPSAEELAAGCAWQLELGKS